MRERPSAVPGFTTSRPAFGSLDGARNVAQRNLARIVAGLFFGALVVCSGTARADERTEARAHFKKGMAEIADGRYDLGIEELKKAYDILPHPNVLYNIARAYVDQGDLENAVAYYKKYLEGNPKDRDEVAQIVSALEARIRKQQAELLEAQRVAPTTTGPGATGTGATGPGAGVPGGEAKGPGAGTQPGGGIVAGGARPGGKATEVPGGGPGLAQGGLKTEEVFEETVVTASKTAQSPLDAPSSTSIITEQDIRLSGITKIPELLRRLAGVDIMETTGAQTEVSLRGFNQRLSNKVLVLVNGRSVYIDLIGSTFWGVLSIGVEDIDRIEVVRGPGSALYGADAFNGVINIITKTPGEGGSGFNVGYGEHNTTHGTIYASGRDKETAYRISAGYDYLPRWSHEVPAGRHDVSLFTGDQDISQRSVRLDATVTRQLSKDVSVGLQGGTMQGTYQILGIGPINDIVLTPISVSDVTANINAKHFEVRAFMSDLRGDNGDNVAYVGQSNFPSSYILDVADVEAQYIGDFQTGKGIAHDLHVGGAYRFKSVQWTYQAENQTENHAGFFVHDEIKFGRAVALIGDYRADFVPYLDRIVQSPRASLLIHPTKQSTVRGIVGTAFRTPTFLESYLGFPVQLPLTGAALISEGQRSDNQGFKVNPEQNFVTELGYLNSDSEFFTFDSAFFYNHANNLIELAPNRAISLGDVANPNVPTAPQPATGFYPVFLGGFENQCQQYNVYGAEVGVRTFPTEGLDVYANGTAMDVKVDTSGCSSEQLSLLGPKPDARTSALKVNTGIQLRTKFGVDGSIDFHYVSAQDWNEQITDLAKQRIEYQSFHLDPYTLLNASVGYRFFKNQAEIRGVAFNLLDDQHREHPFGQYIDRRLMGYFSYKF
jgi:iron complex outermembrane receptor protein